MWIKSSRAHHSENYDIIAITQFPNTVFPHAVTQLLLSTQPGH